MSPFELGHVESRRRALAGHVGDEHPETAGTQREKVVVIAPDFASRHAERRHAEARHVELTARQERHLNLAGDAQLLLEALFLGGRLEQILDAAGHLVEGTGELSELILGVDVDAVREVSLTDSLGAHEELVNRARNRARECQPHDERDEFDDEEQHSDGDQAELDHVAQSSAFILHRLGADESPVELRHPEAERHHRPLRRLRRPVDHVERTHGSTEQFKLPARH